MGLIVYSDYILFVITLLVLILASMMDFKKREVYDFFSGSLILLGLMIRIYTSILELNFRYTYIPLLYFIVVFIITYILYRFGQWGGGDSKILLGFTISSSYLPTLFSHFNFMISFSPFIQFILLTLIIGMIYTVIWMLGVFILNIKEGLKLFYQEIKKEYNIFFITLLIVFLFFIENNLFLYYYIILVSLFLLINVGLVVESNFMNKLIKSKYLREGDWIMETIKDDKQIIYKPKKSGIDLESINKIKDYNPNLLVKIKLGVPFVPVFLLSYLFMIFVM